MASLTRISTVSGFIFLSLSCYVFLAEGWRDVLERRWLALGSVLFAGILVLVNHIAFFPFGLISEVLGIYLAFVVIKAFTDDRHKFPVVFWMAWAVSAFTTTALILYAQVL